MAKPEPLTAEELHLLTESERDRYEDFLTSCVNGAGELELDEPEDARRARQWRDCVVGRQETVERLVAHLEQQTLETLPAITDRDLLMLFRVEPERLTQLAITEFWKRHPELIQALKGWTQDWPTEPGQYWFIGWTSQLMKRGKPELILVRTSRNASGQIMWIGHDLMYKQSAYGWWLRAMLPTPPPEVERDLRRQTVLNYLNGLEPYQRHWQSREKLVERFADTPATEVWDIYEAWKKEIGL